VTAEAFGESLRGGAPLDLLDSFEPKPGDAVLVPAGTVHAAAGGLLLAEIQQSSETTYRLWDGPGGGAGRPLQVERGLEAIRPGGAGPRTVEPREVGDDGNLRRVLLVATRWFQAEHLTAAGTATFETPLDGADPWHLLFFLSGEGVVRAFDRRAEKAPFRPGDTLLLPAGHDQYEIEPRRGKVVQALAFRPV
jgi:mannose-6-phosphate isomerase